MAKRFCGLARAAYRLQAVRSLFGEHCTKRRIMNVLNYKKPAFWVILVALLAALATTPCSWQILFH
jgi:hypothetical protein